MQEPSALCRGISPRLEGKVSGRLSYCLGIGYLVAISGPLDRHTLPGLIGVSAIWWGIWGLLVWVLGGLPAFWQRKRRKR